MKSICETCRNIPCWDYDTRGDKECMDYDRMSNADRIRSMTDEELAGWMNHLFPTLAYEWLLDWLKQEVRNEQIRIL